MDRQQPQEVKLSVGSALNDWFSSFWGKIITILSSVTLLLGIAAEVVSIYRNYQEEESARIKNEAMSFNAIRDLKPVVLSCENGADSKIQLIVMEVKEAVGSGSKLPVAPSCKDGINYQKIIQDTAADSRSKLLRDAKDKIKVVAWDRGYHSEIPSDIRGEKEVKDYQAKMAHAAEEAAAVEIDKMSDDEIIQKYWTLK